MPESEDLYKGRSIPGFNVEPGPGGLLVATLPPVAHGNPGLHLPSSAREVPVSRSTHRGLIQVTDEELLAYGQPETVEQATAAEIIFNIQQVKRIVVETLRESLASGEALNKLFAVLDDREDGTYYEHLQRQVVIEKKGKMDVPVSKPGLVEQAGMAMIDLLAQPRFAHGRGMLVADILFFLLRSYNNNANAALELTEMPDLAQKAIEALDHYQTSPKTRVALYNVLRQIKFPKNFNEVLRQKMEQYNDLSHPLADIVSDEFVARKVTKQIPNPTEGERNCFIYLEKQHITNMSSSDHMETSIPRTDLETVAIAMLAIVKDPGEKEGVRSLVARSLLKILEDYRITQRGNKKDISLPEFAENILATLPHIESKLIRSSLYSALEHLDTHGLAYAEKMLFLMREQGDLDHPLAFALTLTLAKTPAGVVESQWFVEQRAIRERMIELLKGSPQELFDNFPLLFELSQQLVYYGDPERVIPGKVGFELEFIFKREWQNILRNARRSEVPDSEYGQRAPGLKGWSFHYDQGNVEVTRNDTSLTHNREYLESLYHLRKFLNSYAQVLLTMHLQFDQIQHPIEPRFGALFATAVHEPNALRQNYFSGQRTWEPRYLYIPRASGGMNPARVADLIGLYIGATAFDQQQETGEKIKITGENVSLSQAMWGHMVRFTTNPTARLALLMALHEPHSLSYINPLAFIYSYERESLPFLANSIVPFLEDESQLALCRLLTAVGAQSFLQTFLHENPDVKLLALHALKQRPKENKDLLFACMQDERVGRKAFDILNEANLIEEDVLIHLAKEGNDTIRAYAIGSLPATEAMQDIFAHLVRTDPIDYIRTKALEQLSKLRPVADPIFQEAVNDPSYLVARKALRILANNADGNVQVFIDILHSDREELHYDAASILIHDVNLDITDVLERALFDPKLSEDAKSEIITNKLSAESRANQELLRRYIGSFQLLRHESYGPPSFYDAIVALISDFDKNKEFLVAGFGQYPTEVRLSIFDQLAENFERNKETIVGLIEAEQNTRIKAYMLNTYNLKTVEE